MSDRFARSPNQRELLELRSPDDQIVYLFANRLDLLIFGLIEFAAPGVYRVNALSVLSQFDPIQRLASNLDEGKFVRFTGWLETELDRNATVIDLR